MASEDFPLNAWDLWTSGGPPPPAPPSDYRFHALISGGSRNHPPMINSTYALGAALGKHTHPGARAAIDGCRENLAVQRRDGHVVDEAVTGYTGFHEGAVACMALAGRAWYHLTGEPDLWLEAIGWWADHLEIWRKLRMADGQVLSVGARVHPDARNHASNAVFGVHLLDPLPYGDLVLWMRRLFTPDAGRGADRTGDLAAPGWDFDRYSWTRMILRARDSKALPAGVIQRLADSRQPRLIRPLYRWSEDGFEHAAMPEIKGLGPRQWWCRWRPGSLAGDAWRRIDYPSGERAAPHGEPAPWLLPGRGPHESPTPIPIPRGLKPAFGPDTSIPPLPTLKDLGLDGAPPPPPPEEEEPMPDTKMVPEWKVRRWLTEGGAPSHALTHVSKIVWQAQRQRDGEPKAEERMGRAVDGLRKGEGT